MSSLTVFHDNLRQILEDVQKFLVITLKPCTLPKAALAEKEAILEKLKGVKAEKPHWLPELDEDFGDEYEDCDVVRDTSTNQEDHNASKDDEDSHSFDEGSYKAWGSKEVHEDVPAATLSDPIKAGYLDKKRKHETGLLKLQPYQKRWCVIKGNTLYYYASPKDRKQKGAFTVDDYEARPCVTNKKDSGFELVCPGHRTYVFSACSPEECSSWLEALATVSKATSELSKVPIDADDEGGEDYVDPNEVVNYIEPEEGSAVSRSQAQEEMANNKTKGKKSLPPLPVEEAVYDDGDNRSQDIIEEDIYNDPEEDELRRRSQTPVEEIIEEEVYDDASVLPSSPPEIPDTPRPNHTSVSSPSSPPAVDEDGDEIYDDTDVVSSPPPLPQSRALPPSPAEKKEEKPVPDRETDVENLYLAMWDCEAGEINELSFKRGDVIHIIGHEYEQHNWLTGELGGATGLVPKNYLMRAYERIQ